MTVRFSLGMSTPTRRGISGPLCFLRATRLGSLALALLVTGLAADHAHHALAAHDLAVLANPTDGRSDLHGRLHAKRLRFATTTRDKRCDPWSGRTATARP